MTEPRGGPGPNPAERPKRPGWLQWLRFSIGAAVVGVTFYFLVSRLVHDWNQIPFHELHFAPVLLVLSFAILLFLHFPLGGYAWQQILTGMGERLPLIRATAIMTVTQLGKYIPGKLWFTLGRVSLCKRDGIPEAKTLVSVLVEIALQLLAAVLLLGIALLAVPRSSVPGPVYLFLLLAPLCFVAIYPPVLNWALRLVLKRLKRPIFELRLSYGRMAWITGTYLVDWTIQGIGCFVLINSFYPLPFARLPVMLGGYAISWMIGFLALVAPAGLGIREGIFSVILKMVMPAPVAIISVLITRVWMSVSETAMALICFPIVGRRRHNNETTKAQEA